jgi:hypothetical protein
MTNGYLTFLDYLELRRRVERRLASGKWFLLHAITFGVGAAIVGTAGWSPYYDSFRNYFIDPAYGFIIGSWSALLLIHGLWSYWHSGAHGAKRNEAIEREMRQRVEAHDLYLSDHPKDLFRLHCLINSDIRSRASMISVLLTFIVINAVIWIPWAILEADSSFAWQMAPMLVIPLLLALTWNFWRRGRHEVKLRNQMEQLFGSQSYQEDDYPEREMRLSDSDELVTVDEYMMKRKRN